ncbi:oligosaccharide flippase family protein [Xanthobacter sp. KR7-65]|uniref:lipopolysaccharide biosynthesis protein n=1 Tax=Xanthobacter sp. KR7-65 TaxID=3156612 RepID=UPI0032B314EE
MSAALPRSLPGLVATYGVYLAAMMARGLELVGKLGLYMVGARILGVHDSGYFFLCLTWVGVFATVSRGGFERAVVRHVAAELAVGKGRAARHAFLTGTMAVLAFGLTVSLATGALSGPIATYLFRDPEAARPLFLAAFVILPQAMCYFVGNALMGLHKGAWGQLVQNGLWPCFTLAALLAGVHSLNGILIALAAANAAATLVGLVLVWRERHRFVDTPSDMAEAEHLPPLWRTAMPLAVVETVQILLPSLPVLLLATFGLPAQVGAFSVACRISMLTWVVSASIGSVAAPSFAARHRQGQWDALRQLNRKVRLAVGLFSAPLLLAMFFFPATILHLVGPGFEIAATALIVLAVGQLVYALLPCQEIVLAMAGHGGILRWLTVAQTAVCLLLCVLLIPPFGMIGAAIATAVFASQLAIGSALAVVRIMPRAF